MPKYQKKTNRRSWNDDVNIERAINEVLDGKSCNSVADVYRIPEATLRRYVKKRTNGENLPVHEGRFRETFSEEQSLELYEYVKNVDKRAFGLTLIQLRQLAFQFAERNGIPNRFNIEKRMAGKDWAITFAKKWKLSLRKPESMSLARLIGFNKVSVGLFFDIVCDLYKKHQFSPENIYNADETGVSTVPTKVPKVFSPKGNRRVAKIVSAERGKNTTVVCAANATGNYIPPFFVFGRIRMKDELLYGAPVSSSSCAQKNGWMDSEIFLKYLQHFKKYVKCTSQDPVILFVDNHRSHTSLQAIDFARDSGIIMVGFPPHTTHRLQPMDVSIFGLLKTYFSQECDSYMVNHPGTTITDKIICELFRPAYEKAATIANAVNGFRRSGIFPFNRNIFDDADFAPSLTTERPEPVRDITNDISRANDPKEADMEPGPTNIYKEITSDSDVEDNQPLINLAKPKPPQVEPIISDYKEPVKTLAKEAVKRNLFTEVQPTNETVDPNQAGPSGIHNQKIHNMEKSQHIFENKDSTDSENEDLKRTNKCRVSVEEIRPFPKANRSEGVVKRKKISARIITGTPLKTELEEKARMALEKEERKNRKKNKANQLVKKANQDREIKLSKNSVKQTGKETKSECEVIACPGCEEPYVEPPTKDWIQCTSCEMRWHEDCSNFDSCHRFVCDFC